MKRCASALTLLLLISAGCAEQAAKSRGRSEAVSSASAEMSGPALFGGDALGTAVEALRARNDGKFLRLEIRARELVAQVEDSATPSGVAELHYRDGKVSEPEAASLCGKGQLADNLFDLAEVKLDALPALAREAVRRIDPEAGSVDYILVRRDLPSSDEVRLRVYVQSPRKPGYIDADRNGQPL